HEIRTVTLARQPFGDFGCSQQSQLLAGGPDEGHIAISQIGTERPGGSDKRGAADTVIHAASAGAAAEKIAIFLGDRHPIADLDSKLRDFIRIVRSGVEYGCGFDTARPLKSRLLPAFGKFEHSAAHSRFGMNEHG